MTRVTLVLLLAFAASSHAAETAPGNAVPCLIEPQRQVKLVASVPGVLEEVLVDRGDRVTKGMLLAQLETAVEAADLAAAELHATDESTVREKAAHWEFAESKRARQEKLSATQFVSPTALEEATAEAKQAQAAVQTATIALRLAQIDRDRARAKLAQRSIRSPFDGVVIERALSQGEYAYEQTHVLTVAELDPLSIEAFLPIALYGSIAVGATAEVRPEAPVGGRYTATVVTVDRVLDSRSGTFGVRLRLANPGAALPAGIRCTLAITG